MRAAPLYYASLAAAILFGIAGQITLKSGALRSPTVVAQFFDPLTMIGFAIYVLAALLYIVALKEIPVSVAFPSVSNRMPATGKPRNRRDRELSIADKLVPTPSNARSEKSSMARNCLSKARRRTSKSCPSRVCHEESASNCR